MSDVALLKRLRKCKEWLRALCERLFQERGIQLKANGGKQFRLFDATDVKEPGKTGSLWRVHYSVSVPELVCDFFKLTATKGKGTGETCRQFPIGKGERIIADRGYCARSGVWHVASCGGYSCIRVNPQSMPLLEPDGARFPLKDHLKNMQQGGEIKEWQVAVETPDTEVLLQGRLCVIRKFDKDIAKSKKNRRQVATRKKRPISEDTLLFAEYVIVFSTFPEKDFSTKDVLDAYRLRWQMELVFKRFKQIARFGHLPKHDDESSKAWLYGKLLVALLTEKLIAHANALSPWRHEEEKSEERMGGIQFHVSPSQAGDSASLGFIADAFSLA